MQAFHAYALAHLFLYRHLKKYLKTNSIQHFGRKIKDFYFRIEFQKRGTFRIEFCNLLIYNSIEQNCFRGVPFVFQVHLTRISYYGWMMPICTLSLIARRYTVKENLQFFIPDNIVHICFHFLPCNQYTSNASNDNSRKLTEYNSYHFSI